MPIASMTSRQRVEAMFRRGDHDRVPRCDYYWPATLRRWRKEGMRQDPHTQFDLDIVRLDRFCACPFPGRWQVIREDEQTQVIIDHYGATQRFWKDRTGTPEHLGVECTSAQVWEQSFKPLFESQDQALNLEALSKACQVAQAARRWVCLSSTGPFSTIRTMLGDEAMLLAVAAEPDWIRDMAQVVTDTLLRMYQQVHQAGIAADGLWLYDDLAYTHAPYLSREMYRELFWPQHHRLVTSAHRMGMRFILHSDGDVRQFIDDFIEAGIDCIQPLEAKASMDVRQLAPARGKHLAMMGNIDQTVCMTGNREAIEHEVVSKLRAGMTLRAYCYHSDHSVPPNIGWSTYQYVMQLVDQHGHYS